MDASNAAPVSRTRRRRRRYDESLVNLTSMVDVLAVLMFFLLTIFSGGGYLTVLPQGLALPTSDVRVQLKRNLEIAILPDEILVEREPVGDDVAAFLNNDELLLPNLHEVLSAQAPPEEAEVDVPVEITIMADRSIPFRLLKKVMYTVDQAGFANQSLAVRQVGG